MTVVGATDAAGVTESTNRTDAEGIVIGAP